jgi:hypothetical protein
MDTEYAVPAIGGHGLSSTPRRVVIASVLAFVLITAAGETYAKWWPLP